MAKKKIGIYGVLESTANKKVEDLYIIVDESAIAFSVKNNIANTYQCFEYFVNDPENIGWNQLVAYLQNNSKLIQNTYANIYFVMNNSSYMVTKKYNIADHLLYKNELSLLHEVSPEEEVQLAPLATAFSADPLTDAAFAGLIGTAQRTVHIRTLAGRFSVCAFFRIFTARRTGF